MVVRIWEDWVDSITSGVANVPDEDLERVAFEILCADIVLTAGNGGSAALASHMAQAIAKPDYKAGGGRPAVCLNDNVATQTAHSNDGGSENALVECARPFLDIPRCALILFSSSGKSENIVRLAKLALEKKRRLVAFTGFAGEPLRSLAHVSLHIESDDYEVIEPSHDALLHRIQYHLRAVGAKSKKTA